MKQLILSAFLFIFSLPLLFSQNEFYDAKTLARYVSPTNKKFAVEGNQVDTIKSIFKKYDYQSKDNVFLDTFLSSGQTFSIADVDINNIKLPKIASLGSLNVTNIADGIAQFLIKRGKEELNVAFFERIKKFLNDPGHPEIKTLFPVTIEILSGIDTYRYAELIQSLREAFHKDLSNLVISLNQLIDLPNYKELLKNLPEIRAAVRTSKIVSELSQSEEGILPDSLLHSLALLPELQEISSNLGNSLKMVDIFSQSIREIDTSKGRRWVKLSDLNGLVNNKIAFQIFLGLIYQKVKNANIQFNTVRVDKFMKDNVNTIFVISGLIENFAILVNDIDRTIKDFKDKRSNGTIGNDDYYTYISKVINITEYGYKIGNTIEENIINDKYIIMARNANELYKNIYTKNYNNAVMNVYIILKKAFTNLSDSLKKMGPSSEVIEKILKYGNFMASVVKAESGEDVQKALEAAALPAGSYSVKQKSAFNISINGYIGYAWDFNKFFKDSYARGIYAPVGISISGGSRKKRPTLSAFVSIIDVGGIATYRLEKGNTDSLKQEVRLESIFSPSVQLIIEPIRGFPLAIASGWRQTPKLFYSDNTSFKAVTSKDVFNFSILIDIPIFTIINKPFHKK